MFMWDACYCELKPLTPNSNNYPSSYRLCKCLTKIYLSYLIGCQPYKKGRHMFGV